MTYKANNQNKFHRRRKVATRPRPQEGVKVSKMSGILLDLENLAPDDTLAGKRREKKLPQGRGRVANKEPHWATLKAESPNTKNPPLGGIEGDSKRILWTFTKGKALTPRIKDRCFPGKVSTVLRR